MATTSTSALFTRSWWLSNAAGTPKSLLAASADSRRLVDSAVISKSSESDFKAGMCACAAHPRSGLAPMMPTRILFAPALLAFMLSPSAQLLQRSGPGDQLVQHGSHGLLVMGRRLERREVFEVGHHRKQHLRTYGRDVHLGQDEPQLLDSSRAPGATVAHEPGSLVFPFGEEEIDCVLQSRRNPVVVLRR